MSKTNSILTAIFYENDVVKNCSSPSKISLGKEKQSVVQDPERQFACRITNLAIVVIKIDLRGDNSFIREIISSKKTKGIQFFK